MSWKHLQRYSFADPEHAQELIRGMEAWLRGNERDLDGVPGDVKTVWTEQIDASTLRLRRLIHTGRGEYTIIRTTKAAKTPQNLLHAFYVTLIVDEDNPRQVVANDIMESGQAIWIESPVPLWRNVTFLVVKIPNNLLVAKPSSILLVEPEEAFLQHKIEWYRRVLEKNYRAPIYVCPKCRKPCSDTSKLYTHFKDTKEHDAWACFNSRDNKYDRDKCLEVLRESLKCHIPDNEDIRHGKCFNLEWVIGKTFQQQPSNVLFGEEVDQKAFLQHQIDWYRQILRHFHKGGTHVCPKCHQIYASTSRLYDHFEGTTEHDVWAYYREAGRIIEALREFLQWNIPDNEVPSSGNCFNLEWVIENTFQRMFDSGMRLVNTWLTRDLQN
ncbi:hypothetical protein N7490_004458 [Penicillium lividum]|nr:hypothetical protein N7490_004458 [Penicillium lividum]